MRPSHPSVRSACRRYAVPIGILSLIAGVAVPARILAAPDAIQSVAIEKFAYSPGDLTIPPGTTVVWTNRDETPHTVTSRDKSFASKGMDTGDRYEHRFDVEGDFGYVCAVHPYMIGTVHVRK